jgi:acyl-CoA reductase-like NAD-dependent aldehyde dehydrogenase
MRTDEVVVDGHNGLMLDPTPEALAMGITRALTGLLLVGVAVVTGAGRVVGDALVRHPITQMVSVTGSVQRRMMRAK